MKMAALMLLAATTVQAGRFDGWSREMKISFAGYRGPETLTNFPALVVLGPARSQFRYGEFRDPAGADLRFSDATRTLELNYEIEEWNTNGSSFVWVQVPTISHSNDFVYAYWGCLTNAPPYATNGAIWADGYAGVWHLKEDRSSTGGVRTYRDSTAYRNDGDDFVAATGKVGQVNGGQQMDGVGDYIRVLDTGSALRPSNQITVSVWIRPRVNLDGYKRMVERLYSESWYLGSKVAGNPNGVSVWITNAADVATTANNVYGTGTWSMVAFTYDRLAPTNQVRIYVNGVLRGQGNCTNVLRGLGPDLRFGAYKAGGYAFDGSMDEVRMSSVPRSSNWLWACWLNQASNSAFIGYSAVRSTRRGTAVLIK